MRPSFGAVAFFFDSPHEIPLSIVVIIRKMSDVKNDEAARRHIERAYRERRRGFLAWAGGGTGVDDIDAGGPLLAVHVGLMLAGFAGFTVAAGMAALYLWEEHRLKRRDTRVLRLRLPPLVALDRLASRVVVVSLAFLTAGIVVGLASFDRGDFDVAMAVTIAIWALFSTLLVLRREGGLHGRRLAYMLLSGFALVAVVLPLTHFAS